MTKRKLAEKVQSIEAYYKAVRDVLSDKPKEATRVFDEMTDYLHERKRLTSKQTKLLRELNYYEKERQNRLTRLTELAEILDGVKLKEAILRQKLRTEFEVDLQSIFSVSQL